MSSSISPLSQLIPPISSPGGLNPAQLQNTTAAINEIKAIPAQLKAQARNWAAGELSNLITVLHVTLQDDPSSAQAITDLAKGISSDAQDIATGDGAAVASAAPVTGAIPTTGASSASSLNVQETQTLTVVSATIDGNQATINVAQITETESLSVQTTQTSENGGEAASTGASSQESSSVGAFASDESLLGQAYVAIGQAKKALESDTQGRPDHDNFQRTIDGSDADIKNALNGVLADFAAALSGGPLSSIAAAVSGPLNVIA